MQVKSGQKQKKICKEKREISKTQERSALKS